MNHREGKLNRKSSWRKPYFLVLLISGVFLNARAARSQSQSSLDKLREVLTEYCVPRDALGCEANSRATYQSGGSFEDIWFNPTRCKCAGDTRAYNPQSRMCEPKMCRPGTFKTVFPAEPGQPSECENDGGMVVGNLCIGPTWSWYESGCMMTGGYLFPVKEDEDGSKHILIPDFADTPYGPREQFDADGNLIIKEVAIPDEFGEVSDANACIWGYGGSVGKSIDGTPGIPEREVIGACPKGKFCPGGNTCDIQECDNNFMTTLAGSKTEADCTDCKPGHGYRHQAAYSYNDTACQRQGYDCIPAGYLAPTELCADWMSYMTGYSYSGYCPDGGVMHPTYPICILPHSCDPITVNVPESTTCTACRNGYYSPGGKGACTYCGSNMTTANEGSTSAVDCRCNPGYGYVQCPTDLVLGSSYGSIAFNYDTPTTCRASLFIIFSTPPANQVSAMKTACQERGGTFSNPTLATFAYTCSLPRTSTAVCKACTGNTYSPGGKTECMSCPTGAEANAGHTGCGMWKCGGGTDPISAWNNAEGVGIINSGSGTKTLQPGRYMIDVAGGGGGGGGASCGGACTWGADGRSGGNGDKKSFEITLTSATSFTYSIGSGGNGGGRQSFGNHWSGGGGNGGTSTLNIRGTTYTALGGYGGGRRKDYCQSCNCTWIFCQVCCRHSDGNDKKRAGNGEGGIGAVGQKGTNVWQQFGESFQNPATWVALALGIPPDLVIGGVAGAALIQDKLNSLIGPKGTKGGTGYVKVCKFTTQ